MIAIDLAKTLEIPEVEIKLINADIKPENVFAKTQDVIMQLWWTLTKQISF